MIKAKYIDFPLVDIAVAVAVVVVVVTFNPFVAVQTNKRENRIILEMQSSILRSFENTRRTQSNHITYTYLNCSNRKSMCQFQSDVHTNAHKHFPLNHFRLSNEFERERESLMAIYIVARVKCPKCEEENHCDVNGIGNALCTECTHILRLLFIVVIICALLRLHTYNHLVLFLFLFYSFFRSMILLLFENSWIFT